MLVAKQSPLQSTRMERRKIKKCLCSCVYLLLYMIQRQSLDRNSPAVSAKSSSGSYADESDYCGWGPHQQWSQACRRPQEGQIVRFCSSDDLRLFTCTFVSCTADAVLQSSLRCGADLQGVDRSLKMLCGFLLQLLNHILKL